ncbi:MAG: hypothetical protein QW046_04650, partial [Candidatus Micrarchaeaceae archaeon]
LSSQDIKFVYLPYEAYTWLLNYSKAYGVDITEAVDIERFQKLLKTYLETEELRFKNEVYILPKPYVKWFRNFLAKYGYKPEDIEAGEQIREMINKYNRIIRLDARTLRPV